jgi:PAS domain S-box-containing protein
VSDLTELARQLSALGGDIHQSLEEVQVPMYVLDRAGTIKWLNQHGNRLLPQATGRQFGDLLAPEEAESARRRFARRVSGETPFVDHAMVLTTSTGERHAVEISSAPLREGHRIVGVFGIVRSDRHLRQRVGARPTPSLTPRQHEVLQLLGAGLTTRQMAEQMGLSVETVRNHVRAVLAQLGAGSRLEAVLLAHRLGVLETPAAD